MPSDRSQVVVRRATLADAPTIGVLIDAMDSYYLGQDVGRDTAASAAMAALAIESREGTRFLLAHDGGTPVGIACFAVIRPGRRLEGLVFLKDLFVVASHRGQGIGRQLMQNLAAYACQHGIGRIDLTTDARNTGAARLYAELGGAEPRKRMFTFEGAALAALAEGGGTAPRKG